MSFNSTIDNGRMHCHFVWIGRELPYFARLAIESALVAMPDAMVHVHYVGRSAAGRHADLVASYERVSVHAEPIARHLAAVPGGAGPYLELVDRIPRWSPAAVSNLVRLAVLHRLGGVYLDTDVLVLRGLHDPMVHGAFVGAERVWEAHQEYLAHGLTPSLAWRAAPWAATWLLRRADSRIGRGRWHTADRLTDRGTRTQINNAVIGAPPASAFVGRALTRALEVDVAKRFALGPVLLDGVVRDRPDLVHVVPASRFYAVPPGQSYRWFEDEHVTLPRDAQVAHYVASNHRQLLDRLRPDDPRFERRRAPFWRLGREVQLAARELPRQHVARVTHRWAG